MKNNYISLSCRTKNGQTRAIILREVLGLPRPFGTLPLIKRENEGGVARVDYGKPLSQTMDEYDAALEAGVQSGLKTLLSAREQEAVDRMEEAIAEEESELRFSFIGVVGAQNMDNADGGGRRDGLQVAQDMEAAGKGANVIKMATGWEVGADGKWRYEIPDLQYMGKLSNRWKKLGNFIYAPELFAAYPDLKDMR